VTAGSHPEANGCCEHFVRTFQQSLSKLGADGRNWNLKVEETIRGYNGSRHSTIGCTPFDCHTLGKYKNTEFYKKVLERVIKYREGLVKADKRVEFQVGDWVIIIPRKKSNMKRAAEIHFIDRKWGPAAVMGILPMNRIKVLYLGEEKVVNGWEACKVNITKAPT
jgi:hypothetical protein